MAMKRVFYSFHYRTDNWRAAQVRNIGVVHNGQLADDNDWEPLKDPRTESIRGWIQSQMEKRACTIVLVGRETANSKWINYEIMQSWIRGMGVVGIRIHGLKDASGSTSKRGRNPFDNLYIEGRKLSTILKCYDPQGIDSRHRYSWIKANISDAIEEAIEIRRNY